MIQAVAKCKSKSSCQTTTITAAIASPSSINQDTLNTQLQCGKCSYGHKKGKCPTYGRDAYNCGKAISPASVEDQEGSPQRTNGTLNAKEVNPGHDHTAKADITANQGTGQTTEDTSTGIAEAITVKDPYPQTTTDHHQ